MNIVDFSKEVYLINICLLTNIQYSNNVTSPKILNKELFPHPFGPQTNTFMPERTCGEKNRVATCTRYAIITKP